MFPHFARAVSVSQSRRIAAFLPLPFAFAGGLAVLARLLRLGLVPLALAAGIVLEHEWPGSFGYSLGRGGPAAATWIAAYGSAVALVVAVVARRRIERLGVTVALAALAFVLPIAVHGFARWSAPPTTPPLDPALVRALRAHVHKRDVLLADVETSYRIAAQVPVYVVADPPAHVADTRRNRPYRRAADVAAFLHSGSLAIPRHYRARWIVLDRRVTPLELRLPRVFADSRYTLYRL